MRYFSILNGLPTPKLVPDGSEAVDEHGNPLLTLAEASAKCGQPEASLKALWNAAFSWLPKAPASEPADPNIEKPWWNAQPAEMREAIARRHLYPHLSDDQFAVFKSECDRRGIDPASRYIIPKLQANRDTGETELKLITTLNYMRIRSLEAGLFDGRLDALYLDADGKWHNGWPHEHMPVACRVGIIRKGIDQPTSIDVLWREISWRGELPSAKPIDEKIESTPNFYKVSPLGTLQKCAEVASFRAAFPNLFDGLFVAEELKRDETPRTTMHIAEFDDSNTRSQSMKLVHTALANHGFDQSNRDRIIHNFNSRYSDDMLDQDPNLYVQQILQFAKMNSRRAS